MDLIVDTICVVIRVVTLLMLILIGMIIACAAIVT